MPYAGFFSLATISGGQTVLVAIDTRHHGSHHKPLKKSCFEINVKKIATFAGCHLATHPKSWSCGSR